MAASNRLYRHETDIVTVTGVAWTGISKADKKEHDVNGVVSDFAHH